MSKQILSARPRAFTIVELLVVIVLLLVVAAVLYPVFVRVGGHHHNPHINCLSNEKQLGLGFAQYVEDWDEKYPCGTQTVPPHIVPAGWAGQIYPYMKSTDVYQCPDDPTSPDSANSYEVPISYAYNWNIGYVIQVAKPGKTISGINPAKDSDFSDPSRTVLLCEVEGVTCDIKDSHGKEASSPAVLGGSFIQLSNVDGSETGMRYATGVLRNDRAETAVVGPAAGNAIAATGIHMDGSNFVLADGHAKWLRPTAVSAGLSNTINSKDCTAGQGLLPVGKAGRGYAAGTGCPDTSLAATFSIH